MDSYGKLDLFVGTNTLENIPIKKGYYEPVNVQVVNYAHNQMFVDRLGFYWFDK